jgi:intergrase/recombinase
MDESTATRERGRSYVLMKAEEHDVQVRFKAWDDAESARIARELVSDLRVIYPDASEPELAAFIKSLRSRASAPPTSVRKVP